MTDYNYQDKINDDFITENQELFTALEILTTQIMQLAVLHGAEEDYVDETIKEYTSQC